MGCCCSSMPPIHNSKDLEKPVMVIKPDWMINGKIFTLISDCYCTKNGLYQILDSDSYPNVRVIILNDCCAMGVEVMMDRIDLYLNRCIPTHDNV